MVLPRVLTHPEGWKRLSPKRNKECGNQFTHLNHVCLFRVNPLMNDPEPETKNIQLPSVRAKPLIMMTSDEAVSHL